MNRKARRALAAKTSKARVGPQKPQASKPDPAALLEQALAQHQAGALTNAEALYRQIPPGAAEAPLAQRYLGAAYLQGGAPERAIEPLRNAILAFPQEGEPRFHLALAFEALGQAENALEAALPLREMQRNMVQITNANALEIEALIGRLAVLCSHFDQAKKAFEAALSYAPHNADILQQYAYVLNHQDNRPQAINALKQALTHSPNHLESLINLSSFYLAEDTREAAEKALTLAKKATDLAPQEEAARNNLAIAFNVLDRYEDALTCLKDAETALLLPTKATALWRLGHLEAAIEATEKAIQLSSDTGQSGPIGQGGHDPKLLWRLSLYYLHMQRFEDAAFLEDAGFICGERGEDRRSEGVSVNAEMLKTLPESPNYLIWPEQGIGDVIRFAAWLNEPAFQNARLTVECDPRLQPLFVRSFPNHTIRSEKCQGHSYDGQMPIGALPRLTQNWHPRKSHYLIPHPGYCETMQAWLQTLNAGPKIGFVWSSGLQQLRRRYFFAPPDVWAPALHRLQEQLGSVAFINLSYHDTSEDVRLFADRHGIVLHHPANIDMKQDLEHVAALTASLDAVIGIGVSSIEFAGALGVPNIHVSPEFTAEDRDHPVYEPGRLCFRRPGETDWRGVLNRATDALLLYLKR